MTFSDTVWAQQVAGVADLPDRRLRSRLTTILVDTIERPSASIPRAAGDDGQAKAAYRFYANDRVATEALHQGVALETARRCLDQDVRAGRPGHHHAQLHRVGLDPRTGPDRLRRAGPRRAPAHRPGRGHRRGRSSASWTSNTGRRPGRASRAPRRKRAASGSTASTPPATPCIRPPATGRCRG